MEIFKKYYKFIFKYKITVSVSLFLVVVSQVSMNYSLYVFQYLLDEIKKPLFSLDYLINVLLIFGAIKIASLFFEVLSWYMLDRGSLKAQADARQTVLAKIHELDFSFHSTKQSGSLISAIKRGDGAFSNFNITLNQSLLRRLTDYIFFGVAFYALDWRFLMLFILIVLINIVASWFLIKRNVGIRKDFNNFEDELSGKIVDNIINYETVKLFAQEKWEQNRIKGMFGIWYKKVMAYENSFRMMDIIFGLLSSFGVISCSYLSIILYMQGAISLGQMTLVFAFVLTFFPKLIWLMYDIREIVKSMTDMEKYFTYLDFDTEVIEKVGAIDLEKVRGVIDYDEVSFGYKDRGVILNNFDLHIKDGESVALVGYSGAGKTTLMKLLLRYYDPSTGSIKIDGIDIRDVTKESLRKNIGLVPQEPILFNDTIEYNIGYPRPDMSIDKIKETAKMANLDDFIEAQPEKYKTIVGERGIKLSGGQKQRLAIARMFLADPQIIVFDEATSQLDSESEKLIQQAFWRVAKGKTTLIIAHRLSTVMKADRIVVIDKGNIVETGSHLNLIRNKTGIYNKLWNIQKGLMTENSSLL